MDAKKRRKASLSPFGLFSLGFGAIVGAGWSATLNNLMRRGGGAIPAAAGFSLAVLMLIPIVLCFAELSSAIPEAGGVIAYAQQAFGKKTAFWGGWFTAMAYISILPFEAIAVNDIIGCVFPIVQQGCPLYTIFDTDIYPGSVLISTSMSLAILLINWRGFAAGVQFQKINTAILLASSLICLAFALLKASPENLAPVYAPVGKETTASIFPGILAMLGLAPCYLSGFDTIPQSLEFAYDTEPNQFGRIIIQVLLCAGAFYCAVFLSAGLAFPWLDTVRLPRPVLSNLLYSLYPGGLGKVLWLLCMAATLSGLIGVWNSFFIASSRLISTMAAKSMLPAIFCAQHKQYATPYAAFIFCAAIMTAGSFAGAGAIELINTITSAGFIISWAIACLAAIKLRRSRPELARPYKMPFGTVIPVLGTAICIIMLLNCTIPSAPAYMGFSGLIILLFWTLIGGIFNSVYKSV